MVKRTVFFEEISFFVLPVLFYYLLRGDEISIFDFDYNLKRSNWLAKLINGGRVKRIFIKPNSKEHGDAIDATDEIFEKMAGKALPKAISTLYQDIETDLIFKKEMVGDVFRCIYINRYLRFLEDDSDNPINRLLIGSISWKYANYFREYCPERLSSLRNVVTPRWTFVFRWLTYYSNWAKYFLASIAFVLFSMTWAIFGKAGKTLSRKKEFDFVFTIEQAFQTKFEGVRGFDFLLDGDRINKNNTLFLISPFAKKEWIDTHSSNGFQFVRTDYVFRLTNLTGSGYTCLTLEQLLSLLKVLIFPSTVTISFLSAFIKSILAYIKCSALVASFSFKAYIYTNNESSSQIATNIFFRKNGITSWCYLMFLVGGYPRSKSERDFTDHRNILWSFINPDYVIGMNEDVMRYFRLHRQGVRNYCIVGSLYSEMVMKSMSVLSREVFLEEHFHGVSPKDKKICSFFDTTFVEEKDAFASFDDCLAFYSDIAKLLASNANLLVIIKPSKNESFYVAPNGQWSSPEKGEEIIRSIESLKQDARVFFAGDAGDIPSIMAVSDIIVTHCMSSTTAEALGAGKKAIWYESGMKHKGLLYDHVPGLVIHGYADLEKRLNCLLNETAEDVYRTYLDKQIKGKVESHLDGLALTRFRCLLSALL